MHFESYAISRNICRRPMVDILHYFSNHNLPLGIKMLLGREHSIPCPGTNGRLYNNYTVNKNCRWYRHEAIVTFGMQRSFVCWLLELQLLCFWSKWFFSVNRFSIGTGMHKRSKKKRDMRKGGTCPSPPPPHQQQGQVHCSYRCIAWPRRVHCLPPPPPSHSVETPYSYALSPPPGVSGSRRITHGYDFHQLYYLKRTERDYMEVLRY